MDDATWGGGGGVLVVSAIATAAAAAACCRCSAKRNSETAAVLSLLPEDCSPAAPVIRPIASCIMRTREGKGRGEGASVN